MVTANLGQIAGNTSFQGVDGLRAANVRAKGVTDWAHRISLVGGFLRYPSYRIFQPTIGIFWIRYTTIFFFPTSYRIPFYFRIFHEINPPASLGHPPFLEPLTSEMVQ